MKKLYANPTVRFVTTLLLLFSCSKVEKAPLDELPSYLQLSSSSDKRLQPLIDSIWHYERHRPIIKSIISKYGLVNWDNGLIGYRGKTLVAIIPLSLLGASRISGFIAFEMDEGVRFKLYDASRPELGLSRVNIRTVTNVVNALNFKVFGASLARIDDPCAMSRREAEIFSQARSSNPGKKIQLNVRTIEVTTCYSWVTCIGDGEGNCVSNVTHHSDCITNAFWTPDYYVDYWGSGAQEEYNPGGNGDSGGGYSNEPCGGYGVEEDEGMEAFVVLPPEKPIENINRYVDCFTASKRAKITFYADQPMGGIALEFSMKEKAGHAFITIEQTINGSLITRSLGFYARSSVDPFFSKSSVSQLGDNSNESYDVKLAVDVSGLQFASILEIIRNYSPVYDLEKYNCTNFVLDISDAAGLHINRTIATWGVGSGLNPGSFGQDLKKISGTISEKGNAPANGGTCD
ncbi:hypothetical protein GFS24_17690 [Chitinophaga sp. SYP-B3965]|uniref:hypothetical protein n=1 Tax=Chitinophaga sp. SYP-B3965 TaxID=2663120 RepID=UPI001299B2C5|nr:hypothetical protein [Chitinophaga sp. SYP-B3965]MRG46959.1 hypothetical protein [Chitinophaga sp. SYP-B3965]